MYQEYVWPKRTRNITDLENAIRDGGSTAKKLLKLFDLLALLTLIELLTLLTVLALLC